MWTITPAGPSRPANAAPDRRPRPAGSSPGDGTGYSALVGRLFRRTGLVAPPYWAGYCALLGWLLRPTGSVAAPCWAGCSALLGRGRRLARRGRRVAGR